MNHPKPSRIKAVKDVCHRENCLICVDGSFMRKLLRKCTAAEKKWLNGLYDRMAYAETNEVYWKLKYQGKWK